MATAMAACTGLDPLPDGDKAELSGVVWSGGPVASARVQVWQLVSRDGSRGAWLGETTTDGDGRFTMRVDCIHTCELAADGGTYAETAGGPAVALTGPLRGAVLDVAGAERRAGVAITPLTHLTCALADGRLISGADPDRVEALHRARDLVAGHLGFDPTATEVADPGLPAAGVTPPVQHALALAGLSQQARLIVDEGVALDTTTEVLAAKLAEDAAADGQLDGAGDTLFVGATCPPPPGCGERGDGCHARCAVYCNSLRSVYGGAIRAYLTVHTGTGLTPASVATWVEHLRRDEEPALFPADCPLEPFDRDGPRLTWLSPATDGVRVTGTVTVEVVADDPIGVADLTVAVTDPVARIIADTDPSPARFAGTLDTVTPALPEGPITLTATARDADGNPAAATRTADVDNVAFGVASGTVVKGRMGGAEVRVYRYDGGVRGALVGSGTTAADGTFTNLAIADGVNGPLVVEAGGAGTYREEVAPVTVAVDLDQRLRTVVPSYADGSSVSLVITPLTSFATTYLEYLPGPDVATRWAAARTAMAAHFGVADVAGPVPLAPAEMTSLTAAARHGLVLIGLSELAYRTSSQGGGDAGTWGSAATTLHVVGVLDRDLADGCWDGRDGATPLWFGGSQAAGPRSTRLDLASALFAYLTGPDNATPFSAADALGLLDDLATGGGNPSPGACANGRLDPDDGSRFDQTPPAIVWQGATPPAGAWVRATIAVEASAIDDLDPAPRLAWAGGLIDSDGDPDNAIAQAAIDTTSLPDGPYPVQAVATDDSGNTGDQPIRTVQVDNTPPVIAVATAGLYADGAGHLWTGAASPTVTGTVAEANLRDVRVLAGATVVATATVTGTAWSATLPPGAVPDTAGVDLRFEARDLAGNVAAVTRRLRYDATPPLLTTPTSTVRDESEDTVTFATAVDPLLGYVTYDPTHGHGGTPVALGPATPCDASAPHVVKYAYLLDAAPPDYVVEGGGPNPLRWLLSVSDDGVGVDGASVQYRIRDVAAGSYPRDWTALTGAGTYAIDLHRSGASGVPGLGSAGSAAAPRLYAIELRATDWLGRTTTVTRCWNQRSLPAPLYLAAAAAAGDGPLGSGKRALHLLDLADDDPIGATLLDDGAPGAGLIQYAVHNPTTEPVYLTVDLTEPAAASLTYSRTYVHDRWTYTETGDSTPCGNLGGEPDESLPGCLSVQSPGPGVLAPVTTVGQPTPGYTVRVWEEASPSNLIELVPCAGCDQSPPAPGVTRVTVRVPPRAPIFGGNPSPPRKLWVMPSVRGLEDELRPGGVPPYPEQSIGGVVLTGTVEEIRAGCSQYTLVGSIYRCTRRRTYQRYRALTAASLTGFGSVRADNAVSTGGTAPEPPTDLGPADAVRATQAAGWSTSESSLPPAP